eukprot:7681975-Pyramimonas_sp.AAC.1
MTQSIAKHTEDHTKINQYSEAVRIYQKRIREFKQVQLIHANDQRSSAQPVGAHHIYAPPLITQYLSPWHLV